MNRQGEGEILSRNPTENQKRKRGRPKKDRSQLSPLTAGLSGDEMRTILLMALNMDEDLNGELLHLLAERKTSITIVNCVARFPKDQQRLAFEKFSVMGARKAKRWLECTITPPTKERITDSIGAFLWREFPTMGYEGLADACFEVGRILLQLQPVVERA